ncbi:hypothetical protein MC885_011291, partial [Smutsia gigantea]
MGTTALGPILLLCGVQGHPHPYPMYPSLGSVPGVESPFLVTPGWSQASVLCQCPDRNQAQSMGWEEQEGGQNLDWRAPGAHPREDPGRGLGSPVTGPTCLFSLQTRRKLKLLGAWQALLPQHTPTPHQPGHMLSKTEFCLNAQKGDLGDQNCQQINKYG